MGVDFTKLEEGLGPKLYVQGKPYLYFGGTAYLGIPKHKGMEMLFQEGMAKYGLNNGTSRSNNVQLGIYNKAEDYAAELFNSEAALICSSGYLAAYLGVKFLSSLGKLTYSPEVHPSLWREGKPTDFDDYKLDSSRKSKGFKDWAAAIIEEINSSEQEIWVLVSNSLSNLKPEVFDFSVFNQIRSNKRIYFLVDDSHGIGVLNGGLGILPALPKLNNVEWVVVASMAKALGIDAGLVLGSSKVINELKRHEIFLGASPPSAAALHSFIYGKEFYAIEWLKLQKNIRLLESSGALNQDWQWTQDFPVFLFKPGGLSDGLSKKNILISSFAYPDKNGVVLDRIVLSSWHEPQDIQDLVVSLT